MYSLEMEETSGFLWVTASGKLTAETDAAIDAEVAEACRRRGLRRALVDIRAMQGRLSIGENFDAAATFARRLDYALVRIAIVDLARHRQRSELFQLAANNRGANVRFFEDPDEAEAWLTKT